MVLIFIACGYLLLKLVSSSLHTLTSSVIQIKHCKSALAETYQALLLHIILADKLHVFSLL